MIKGMTGFGSAQVSCGDVRAIIEIKSLNHRYLDLNHYLPIGFGSIENKVRLLIQKNIARGKITVSIKLLEKPTDEVILNKKALDKNMKIIKRLKKEYRLENDLSMSDILKLPGVLMVKETIINPEKVWPGLEKGIIKALSGLGAMRKSEGKSLTADLNDKLKRMGVQTKKIKSRHDVVLKEKKKKLNIEEFKSYQKSIDVNEETSRLQHYVVQIKALLKQNVSVGKRIDFIAQEMIRETNTIGSKVQDKVVSNAVIALKAKIEKIREQAQNIE